MWLGNFRVARKSMLKIETVFIYSAPPSLKHSPVVAGQGKADGDLEGVFSPCCRVEGRDHPFNFWVLLPFFGNSDELFAHAVIWKWVWPISLVSGSFSFLFIYFIQALCHERKFWNFGFTNDYTFKIYQFIILSFPVVDICVCVCVCFIIVWKDGYLLG